MRAQLLSTKNLSRNHDKFFDKFAANEFHLARDDLSFSSFFFFLSSLLSFFFSFLFFSQPIVRPPPLLQFLVSRLGHSFLSHRSLFIPFSSYLSPSPPPFSLFPPFLFRRISLCLLPFRALSPPPTHPRWSVTSSLPFAFVTSLVWQRYTKPSGLLDGFQYAGSLDHCGTLCAPVSFPRFFSFFFFFTRWHLVPDESGSSTRLW